MTVKGGGGVNITVNLHRAKRGGGYEQFTCKLDDLPKQGGGAEVVSYRARFCVVDERTGEKTWRTTTLPIMCAGVGGASTL